MNIKNTSRISQHEAYSDEQNAKVAEFNARQVKNISELKSTAAITAQVAASFTNGTPIDVGLLDNLPSERTAKVQFLQAEVARLEEYGRYFRAELKPVLMAKRQEMAEDLETQTASFIDAQVAMGFDEKRAGGMVRSSNPIIVQAQGAVNDVRRFANSGGLENPELGTGLDGMRRLLAGLAPKPFSDLRI